MMIDVKPSVADVTEVSYDEAIAPAAAGDSVVAVVKWFRADKGYGFIGVDDGRGDAFLHIKALRSLGVDTAPMGATVRVQLVDSPRGRQVARVLELDSSSALTPAWRQPDGASRGSQGRDCPVEVTGKVKWFDEVRGFGFVLGDDFGRDVFVHCSILGRTGIDRLEEGQTVTMQVIETVKGRQAVEISR